MAIEFDCPACEATIRVKDHAAGKKGRCPKCKALLLIPDPGPLEEEPVEEETVQQPEPVVPVAPPLQPKPAITPPIEPVVSPSSEPVSPEPISLADIQIRANVVDPVAASAPSVRRRSSRKARRGQFPTAKVASVAAAVLGLVTVIGVGWYLYTTSQPDLTGALTGERLSSVSLSTAKIPPPVNDVSAEEVEKVLTDLRRDELPLKSEYIVVVLSANQGDITVDVTPGPRSVAIRVPLRSHPGVQTVLKQRRDEIVKLKQRELRSATASFIHDFAAFLEGGPPMTKLPEYRNQVALNATVGPVGYSVEAIVSNTPFPCAYEDANGNCYFFPPEGTTSFRLRGRQLGNGTTPLPVDFEVEVVEPRVPSPDKASASVEPNESPETPKNSQGDDGPAPSNESTMENDSQDSPAEISPE